MTSYEFMDKTELDREDKNLEQPLHIFPQTKKQKDSFLLASSRSSPSCLFLCPQAPENLLALLVLSSVEDSIPHRKKEIIEAMPFFLSTLLFCFLSFELKKFIKQAICFSFFFSNCETKLFTMGMIRDFS